MPRQQAGHSAGTSELCVFLIVREAGLSLPDRSKSEAPVRCISGYDKGLIAQ